jgi:peptidyl-prolyl cis-trans isomerase SurA
MGVGLLYVLEAQGRVNTGVFATINELVNPAPAAAVVNGVKIPLATYEKNRAQIEQNAAGQGLTVTDDDVEAEISKQAIDVLVNTELLKQAAAKNGVVVTEEQIDARYDEIVASLGGEAALNAKMLELGISPESLQTDIRGEILIQAYLTQAVDLSVVKIDEAAIKTVYDQANTPEANLPPLDEVRADIEAQLKSTQEQELVNAHIETLRTDAKIETNV